MPLPGVTDMRRNELKNVLVSGWVTALEYWWTLDSFKEKWTNFCNLINQRERERDREVKLHVRCHILNLKSFPGVFWKAIVKDEN